VDVAFKSSGPDTTPPTVASTNPSSGSSNVAINSTVAATFSESINSSIMTFTVVDNNNQTVPGTFVYNATTVTATFTPASYLNSLITYTARISGVKDLAGNAMTSAYSWTFTTAGSGPFSIWSPSATPDTVNTNDAAR